MCIRDRFTTELELTKCGTIRSAFIHAKLFNPDNQEQSLLSLVKRNYKEQVPAHCSSVKGTEDTLVGAYQVLREALIPSADPVGLDSSSGDSYPAVLYTRLVSDCADEVKHFCSD